MTEAIVTRAIYPDSCCVGTAAKNGELKVYFDSSDLEETKRRIDNACTAREYMLQRLGRV